MTPRTPSLTPLRGLALAAGGLALALLALPAAAELSNQGLLDNVITAFATRARQWQAVIMNAASWLFWTLGTISLAWTMGTMVLRKADLGEFFAEFIRFIFFFGFFLWLLRNGPAFASAILESLRHLGAQASGLPGVSPSSMVDIGFLIWTQAVTHLSVLAPISSLVGIFLSSAILLLLAAIAVNMLLLQVSGWILMYAGIFFLGFGGSRWTSDMAINYYRTVLGLAVQLLVMVLLVGIGNDLLGMYFAQMADTGSPPNFNELGILLVFCLALLMLATKVPAMVAGMVTGGTGASSGIGNWGAGTVMGAAMGAASAASAGAGLAAAALGTGAANAAGTTQALMAACNQAAHDAGGGDCEALAGALAGAAGPAPGDAGAPGGAGAFASMDAGQSATRADSSGSSDSSADAGESRAAGGRARAGAPGMFGHAAALAAGTAHHLAQGSMAVGKAKVAGLRHQALERMGQTVGGQIATAIQQAHAAAPEVVAFVQRDGA